MDKPAYVAMPGRVAGIPRRLTRRNRMSTVAGEVDVSSSTCPGCGRRFDGTVNCCPGCGLVRPGAERKPSGPSGRAGGGRFAGALLDPAKPPGTAGLYARGVLLLILLVWGCSFALGPSEARYGYAMRSFMHLVNLPFHEAGHVIFGLAGSRILTSLGGSLMQLLIPLTCAAVLLLKTRDPFGAAVALWWLGESLIDLAPYIADARSLSLPLLGGNTGATAPYGFHDWNFILSETGRLDRDLLYAGAAGAAGAAVMAASIAWGAAVLLRCPGSGRTRSGPDA